jgi:acyl-CoA dehydrogenase
VPFARAASHIALLAARGDNCHVALVERDACVLTERANVAGEPRDDLALNHARVGASARSAICVTELLLMGAAIRATQMAGALQGMLDRTVAYANERVAFEKPIGKFQAIQHSLARFAGETAAALAAAGSAADAIQSANRFDDAVLLEVASAKIRVGEAVTAATAIAHQVHGAIGFTAEHALHRYTQRLWSWRDDFGSESEWALRLGQRVSALGADALWPMLAER